VSERPIFPRKKRAFSLIELLSVMGIMSVLLALTVPAINALKGGSDFTRGVDEVELTLNRARTYAMTQNTYVWVGFYEESALAQGATNTPPPYSGKGRVVMAVVASTDGTKIFDDGMAAAPLPEARLFPLGRVVKISGVHLADVGSPTGSGQGAALDDRPATPYQDDASEAGRISSAHAGRTPFPFAQNGYTFYKTLRFSPSGEVSINGSPVPRRLGEIGLIPTKGDQVMDASENLAAIQFSGMGGNVRAYRR